MISRRYAKLFAALWALLLIGTALTAWLRAPQLDSSILALLPHSDRQPLQQLAADRLGADFSSRLALLVQADSDAEARQLTQNLAQRLESEPAIAELQWRIDSTRLQTLVDLYRPWRFQVLAPDLRRRLENGEFRQLSDEALRRLLSPVGLTLTPTLTDPIGDPFGLLPTLLSGFGNDRIQADHGLMRVVRADRPGYLILATLAGDPFELSLQQALVPTLQRMQSEVAGRGGRLYLSGMLLHAAAGAEQARREISTIGVVSLLGILALVLLAFRRWRTPLLVMLPVLAGCLFAVAVTALLFGRLHLVTLAFGAGLVGVSVDYALHYLATHLASHAHPDSRSVLQRILPGLALGGLSSVLAYGAQALAPFPGLRQMACFAVAGLSAAWLSVVLWYPLLPTSPSPHPGAASARWLAERFRRLPALPPRGALLMLTLSILLALGLLWSGQAKDDLRLLQTSPQTLLAQDRQLGEWLGQSSSTRFLLVTAPDAESLLQTQERLAPMLDRMRQRYPDFDFSLLSDRVPSHRAQAHNRALVEALYADQLDRFFRQLSREDLALKARAALQRDTRGYLELQEWLDSPLHALAPGLWLDTDSDTGAEQAVGIVRLSGSEGIAGAEFAAIADRLPSVQYVDRVEDISSLLTRYRLEIGFWVAGAYLVVLLMLVWRYGRTGWRVVGPPLAAALLAAGVLSHLDGGLNLFHLLALLLVLGLGLDMGIFLQEGSGAPHVWLAVTLSMLTSLLAFGLLVLSATPLLHEFGLTVLLGLGFIWLISLLTRNTYPEQELEHR